MASEEPGPRVPPAGEKTTRASAPATTLRVRAASRARGGTRERRGEEDNRQGATGTHGSVNAWSAADSHGAARSEDDGDDGLDWMRRAITRTSEGYDA